jgi:hypothetical protein
MANKGSPGQRIGRIDSELWVNMVSVGEAYRDGKLQTPAGTLSEHRAAHLMPVKNTTGASRRAGEVVGLGAMVTTELDLDAFSISGIATARGRRFAVLLEGAASNEIVRAQYLGICRGRVDVTNTQHRCARLPSDGTFVLKSCFHGPVDMIWCPDSTGVADCLVCVKEDSPPIFLAPAGGIPGRSGTTLGTANCTPYTVSETGVLTELLSPSGSSQTTAIHNMSPTAVSGSIYIQVKPCFGMLLVDWEDCDA